MKGFVVAIVILSFVIGCVFVSSGALNFKICSLVKEVENGRYSNAKDNFYKIYPFLHLCAPDGILREVELAFCDIASEAEEKEKSRLLLLLEDLRRQVGLCPISVF